MKLQRMFAALGLALVGSSAFAQYRIVGSLSNFDCWNDDYNDCSGFEIEIEDRSPTDIQYCYGGSAFGSPTKIWTGHSTIVRYFSSTVRLHHGQMTHFGVHMMNPVAPTAIKYRWVVVNSFGTGTYTKALSLPKHDTVLVTLDDGSTALRDGIVNTEPSNGKSFFVLPYRIDHPGQVSLDDLMRDSGYILGATPMGTGPNDLDPEQLDPQGSWANDDVASDSEGEESKVFWYKIYAAVGPDQDHMVPGPLLSVMIDNTIIAPDGLQTLTGTIDLGEFGPVAGENVQFDILQPGSTTPVQSYLQPLGANGTFNFGLNQLLPAGNYDIRVFGQHWLAKRVPNVNIQLNQVATVNATLINGDVTGDNVIDLSDYMSLALAFDSSVGDSGYATWVDLNGDGTVDIQDYLILASGFDQQGDN